MIQILSHGHWLLVTTEQNMLISQKDEDFFC